MKKLMMILAGAALLATSAPAFAGNDRPIAVGELPAVSQEFIKTHFAGVEVSFSKVDEELFDKDYKVVFVNGAIDRDRRDYEVELDNGLDLKFDLKFRLIDIDN